MLSHDYLLEKTRGLTSRPIYTTVIGRICHCCGFLADQLAPKETIPALVRIDELMQYLLFIYQLWHF